MAEETKAGRFGERFIAALEYAARKHQGQNRKGSVPVPYIGHLLGVASIVIEDGGDEDEAIAALLHDSVEDQGGAETREEIRSRFGERVAAIVDGCSDTDASPKPPWHQRKAEYIERLVRADPSVVRVSLADKLYNARETLLDVQEEGDSVWERFNVGREEQLWYYRSLVAVFRKRRGDDVLVRELARIVSELERTKADASQTAGPDLL